MAFSFSYLQNCISNSDRDKSFFLVTAAKIVEGN